MAKEAPSRSMANAPRIRTSEPGRSKPSVVTWRANVASIRPANPPALELVTVSVPRARVQVLLLTQDHLQSDLAGVLDQADVTDWRPGGLAEERRR